MSDQDDDRFRAAWEADARLLMNDLLLIHFHRELWSSVVEAITERAPRTDQTWQMHYSRLYVDSQAMAIRRVVRSNNKDPHVSLNSLLLQLEDQPHVAGMSAQEISQDRSQLNRVADDVISWADQTVAHVHKSPTAHVPDLDRLDSAIKEVADTFISYAGKVTRTHFLIDDPLPSPRWRSVFFNPLFDAPPWWPGTSEASLGQR